MLRFRHTRRGFLFLASAARLAAWDGDFWNTKPPSEWDAGEIYRLLNESPWANRTNWMIPPVPGQDVRQGPIITAASQHVGTNGASFPIDPAQLSAPKAPIQTVVTWDSALPVRQALKTDPTDVYADNYVLGVDGLPPGNHSAGYLCQRASLHSTRSPKWTVRAADAFERTRTSSVCLFAFPRTAAHITSYTDSVIFEISCEEWMLSTRFKVKTMLYNGKLAL